MITRQEAAVILSKVLNLTDANYKLEFADFDSIGKWAISYVAGTVKSGIISGYPDNTVKPLNNITIAEAIAIVANAYNMGYFSDENIATFAGTGAPSSQVCQQGESITISSTIPTRSGYTFKEWNTSISGAGTSYTPGSIYSLNQTVTLYAIWDSNTAPTLEEKIVAIYSVDDNSLTFLQTSDEIIAGQTYNGKMVTAVYTEIETTDYTSQPSWSAYKNDIVSIDFESVVSPLSTCSWFYEFTNLSVINNLENLDMTNVANVSNMFNGCNNLSTLNLGNLDTTNMTNMINMFTGMNSLREIILGANFSFTGDGSTTCELPTPSSSYITGADGNWYLADGTAYTPSEITTNHNGFATDESSLITYYAVDPSLKITATAGVGGTISPSGTVSVAIGSNPVFTIVATNGYAI